LYQNINFTVAFLHNSVYEVDPLKCLQCGGTMKVVSFIKEPTVIEYILRHLNMWIEPPPRPPPPPDKALAPPKEVSEGPTLDYEFFEQTCL